jgi:predicted GNAT family acetyltransferase
MTHPLDRPVWTALNTRHASLAEGNALAMRYPAAVSPFAATGDDGEESLLALAALASPGEKMLLVMASEITVPPEFIIERTADAVQMIADRRFDRIADNRIAPLNENDAGDMLELARLTKPGPFSLKALSFGRFWGIKRDGRLIAMAGERMKQPGYTELSGLCTHPDFQGQGLGKLLLRFVAGEICAAGEQPYLHAYATNTKAIALYETIGFRLRRKMNLAFIVKQA